ncbi:homocitrate synthase [Capsaspora owczarzaki ATCC 30864]|uniref:homocitrate synthase n=2 Tax=Capsaspora owczarzaki (strain ATCC 30864) TaxID=595528 RepID=A0A0D2VS04_CAPO3|nr:homocitrate synthase [Capsaspora owczarzaki ATCC 30864]
MLTAAAAQLHLQTRHCTSSITTTTATTATTATSTMMTMMMMMTRNATTFSAAGTAAQSQSRSVSRIAVNSNLSPIRPSSPSSTSATATATATTRRAFTTAATGPTSNALATTLPALTDARRADLSRVRLVDSTLREGEQFSTAFFGTAEKLYIAQALDAIGVEFIEVTTPMASKQSAEDCTKIAKLGLKAKILTHTRCHMDDVRAAVESGVDGVNIYMATSSMLRQYSHGKGIDKIIETARDVIAYAQKHGLQVRFSCEDTFRSDTTDLISIYTAMNKMGVDRVGLADTVGVASPLEVYQLVRHVRSLIDCDIEFHTHDDTGCCIANAFVAVQGGATHIDTCVLGIGERNGITPLGGFLGRLYTIDKKYITSRYNLRLIPALEQYVAGQVGIDIPFNNYITGAAAFTHKAGVHSKAVMQNPEAYEVLNPDDFGVSRHVAIAHRLTGWHAVQQRANQLGIRVSEASVKKATTYIKNLADTKSVTTADLDNILLNFAGEEAAAARATTADSDTSAASSAVANATVSATVAASMSTH